MKGIVTVAFFCITLVFYEVYQVLGKAALCIFRNMFTNREQR